MVALNYLLDPRNAGRHRRWQEIEDARKNNRISQRRAKRLASEQRNLEEAMKRGVEIQKFTPNCRAEDLRLLAAKKKKKKPKPVKQSQTPNPPADPNVRPKYVKGMRAGDFYRTREWFELRYFTLRKLGCTCMCCGATNTTMHVDHIKPRSRFPDLELEQGNLQILCEACNLGKSNKDQTDWRTKGSITQTG